jgi:hypothetical protein
MYIDMKTEEKQNWNAVRTFASLTPCLVQLWLAAIILASFPFAAMAGVPTGDAQSATNYYRLLAKQIEFSTPDLIFETKLDDVAAYMGYAGFAGRDFQDLSPDTLMNSLPQLAVAETAHSFQHPNSILTSQGAAPINDDDILVTRFFAPKIMKINDPEATRQLGWRKLVRLRARPGSLAQKHDISSGIILFNFFTDPGVLPFGPGVESVNTQVILETDVAKVPPPNSDGPPSVYWLDYDALTNGGQLSPALNAFFDADQLPQASNGKQPYFVPDGCVACHGANIQYPLVNYLDTDHWFDRLENDFHDLKTNGIPLVFDAGTNDPESPSFKRAFDVIRKFNGEADAEVIAAQPNHDEALASHKWLEVHQANYGHAALADRAIGPEPRWSSTNTDDLRVLATLNQYCFRCHGTVKFSVFNRAEILNPLYRGLIDLTISTNTPALKRMPPDRPLPDDARDLIHQFTN